MAAACEAVTIRGPANDRLSLTGDRAIDWRPEDSRSTRDAHSVTLETSGVGRTGCVGIDIARCTPIVDDEGHDFRWQVLSRSRCST